ncbi:hypothetical protein [Staphylococcus chromogenes]|uniref:hypothetical protein n=1 Tax=Staphylococcus chromogenes TaxID=46126 RepID=UPI00113DE59A|nr:hypothetical protein [Staphylococcus chromogenes]TJY14281.1 hypothetical protein FCF12_10330 [Staphylococcus chromogenes]
MITTGILVLLPNIISSILWLISGIMLLVRKEKALNYKNSTNGNDPFEKTRPEPHENDDLKKRY